MAPIIDTSHGSGNSTYIAQRASALRSPQGRQPPTIIKELCKSIGKGVTDYDQWWTEQLAASLQRLNPTLGEDTADTLNEAGDISGGGSQIIDDLLTVAQASAWLIAHFREGDAHREGALVLADDLNRLGRNNKRHIDYTSGWRWTSRQKTLSEIGHSLSYSPGQGLPLEDALQISRSGPVTRETIYSMTYDPSGAFATDPNADLEGWRASDPDYKVIQLDPEIITGALSLLAVTGFKEEDEARNRRSHARAMLRSVGETLSEALTLRMSDGTMYRYQDTAKAHQTLQKAYLASLLLMTTGANPSTIRAATKLQTVEHFLEAEERLYETDKDKAAALSGSAQWSYKYAVDHHKRGQGKFAFARPDKSPTEFGKAKREAQEKNQEKEPGEVTEDLNPSRRQHSKQAYRIAEIGIGPYSTQRSEGGELCSGLRGDNHGWSEKQASFSEDCNPQRAGHQRSRSHEFGDNAADRSIISAAHGRMRSRERSSTAGSRVGKSRSGRRDSKRQWRSGRDR